MSLWQQTMTEVRAALTTLVKSFLSFLSINTEIQNQYLIFVVKTEKKYLISVISLPEKLKLSYIQYLF